MTETPSKETQKEYYDKRWSAAISKPINRLEFKRLLSILRMMDQIELTDGMRILDLGCGRGWLSSILSHLGRTTGIDLSSEAVSAARKLYSSVDFRAGDIFKVLTEKDTYDVVVSQEVIEHVEDQPAFVNLVAESLKPGGHFIFTTPNAWTQKHRSREEHERWGLQPIENWIDRRQVKNLLASRFEIMEIASIIDGFGTRGVFRVANSCKLRKLLESIGLAQRYSQLILWLDFGLHLAVHAKRRS